MPAKTATRNGVQVRGRAKRRRRPLWFRLLKITLCLLILVLMIGVTVGGVVFFSAWKDARETLANLDSKIFAISATPSEIIASDGKTVLYQATQEYRDTVAFSEIPKRIILATTAAEDKRFWDHSGVDFRALGRVFAEAYKEGEFTQGGSTLTMQLAKRLYSGGEKTWQRKLKDIALAMNMEKMLTKEQIFELYVNQVFYGNGAYGIKAASKVYFDKDLDQLTISEAALLARLVRTPTKSNPYRDLDRAIQGRNTVLKVMYEEGSLDRAKYDAALKEKVKLATKRFGSGERVFKAPFFVHYVLDWLRTNMPEVDIEAGGYRIETTLDPDLQAQSEKHVKDFVSQYKRRKITTAATLVMNNEGQILAMVGGVDFDRNEYNVITQGRRQPGSSFKPFVYAAALSTGAIGPRTRISNERFVWVDPASGKPWIPKNSSGGFGGSYSIRDALAWSKNVPAVRVAEIVTPEIVVSYGRDVFGFSSTLDPVLSIPLGTSAVSPLEMAQAYSVFQLNGSRATPYGITRVIGPDNRVIKSFVPDIRQNLLDPTVAAQMDSYLRAVVVSGTGKGARSIEDARGKTGTTQDNRDAWFCGYTNNLVCVAWIASERYDPNHKPPWYYEPMPRVFGGTYTVELWRDVMNDAQRRYGRGEELARTLMDNSGGEIRVRDEETTKPEEAPETEAVNPDGDVVPGAPTDSESSSPGGETVPVETPPVKPPTDDPPVQTKPPETDPNRPTEPVDDRVTFEICAETGLKATIYCPETVTRSYKRGSEPSRWCRLHGGR